MRCKSELVLAAQQYAHSEEQASKVALSHACDAALSCANDDESASSILDEVVALLFVIASPKLHKLLLRLVRVLAPGRAHSMAKQVDLWVEHIASTAHPSVNTYCHSMAKPVKALLPYCSPGHLGCCKTVLHCLAWACNAAAPPEMHQLSDGLAACADLLYLSSLPCDGDAFAHATHSLGQECASLLNRHPDSLRMFGHSASVCLARSLVLLHSHAGSCELSMVDMLVHLFFETHATHGINCSGCWKLNSRLFHLCKHIDGSLLLRSTTVCSQHDAANLPRAYALLGLLNAQIDTLICFRRATQNSFNIMHDGILQECKQSNDMASLVLSDALQCLCKGSGSLDSSKSSFAQPQPDVDLFSTSEIGRLHVFPLLFGNANSTFVDKTVGNGKVLQHLVALAKARGESPSSISTAAVCEMRRRYCSTRCWLQVSAQLAEHVNALALLHNAPDLLETALHETDKSVCASFFKRVSKSLRRDLSSSEMYCAWLESNLLHILASADCATRIRMKDAVLPYVLHADFNLAVRVLRQLCDKERGTNILPAIATVFYVVRTHGLTHGRPPFQRIQSNSESFELPLSMIRRACTHKDTRVRLDILAAATSKAYGHEFLSDVEEECVCTFLKYSLGLNNSSDRGEALSSIDGLVTRLRSATHRLYQERLWQGYKKVLYPDMDESIAMQRSHSFLNFLFTEIACRGISTCESVSQQKRIMCCELLRRLLFAKLPDGILDMYCFRERAKALMQLLVDSWPSLRQSALNILPLAAPQVIQITDLAAWLPCLLHDVTTDACITVMQGLARLSKKYNVHWQLQYRIGSEHEGDEVCLRRNMHSQGSNSLEHLLADVVAWANECISEEQISLFKASTARSICVAPFRALIGIVEEMTCDERKTHSSKLSQSVHAACNILDQLKWAVEDQTLVGAIRHGDSEDADEEHKEYGREEDEENNNSNSLINKQSSMDECYGDGTINAGILRSCWFTSKAAMMFLTSMFKKGGAAALEGYRQVLEECGFNLLDLLCSSRHRGVTEKAGKAITELCHGVLCTNFGIDLLSSLWKQLYQTIAQGALPIDNAMRRSSGAPVAFVSLLDACLAKRYTDLIRKAQLELLHLVRDNDTATSAAPKVHALNLLAKGLDHGALYSLCHDNGHMVRCVFGILHNGPQQWELRNASMRLLASLGRRVMRLDMLELIHEQPRLHEALCEALSFAHGRLNEITLALNVFAQCKQTSVPYVQAFRDYDHDVPSTTLQRVRKIVTEEKLLKSPIWRTRSTAAEAYAATLTKAEVGNEAVHILSGCSSENVPWNDLHGRLMLVVAILMRSSWYNLRDVRQQLSCSLLTQLESVPAVLKAEIIRCFCILGGKNECCRWNALTSFGLNHLQKFCNREVEPGFPLFARYVGYFAGEYIREQLSMHQANINAETSLENCIQIIAHIMHDTPYETRAMVLKRFRDGGVCATSCNAISDILLDTAISDENCTVRRRCLQVLNRSCEMYPLDCIYVNKYKEQLSWLACNDENRVSHEALLLSVCVSGTGNETFMLLEHLHRSVSSCDEHGRLVLARAVKNVIQRIWFAAETHDKGLVGLSFYLQCCLLKDDDATVREEANAAILPEQQQEVSYEAIQNKAGSMMLAAESAWWRQVDERADPFIS